MRFFLISLLFIFSTFSYAEEGVKVDSLSNTQAVNILSNYKLGPGDVLTIKVYGEDDLQVNKVRLTDTGTITFPSVGEVSVLNHRTSEVEELIASKLRGRILVNPKVSASVDEYRPFYIAGGVKKPGGIAYQAQLTVGKAVSLAGGFTDNADKKRIFVMQSDNKKIAVTENSFVSPGDNLVIEEYEPIFINGMVTKPGSYPYQEGLNVRKAVSLASGFHERASLSKIFIIKANDVTQKPVPIKLDDPVSPGDIITVEESFF